MTMRRVCGTGIFIYLLCFTHKFGGKCIGKYIFGKYLGMGIWDVFFLGVGVMFIIRVESVRRFLRIPNGMLYIPIADPWGWYIYPEI